MKGSVYPRCFCRDPGTGKPLGSKCPDLRKKGHAAGWFFRFDAPRAPGEKRRRPEIGPFATKKQVEEELAAALAQTGAGGSAPDRSLKTGPYLKAHLAGKRNLKPASRATDEEAFRLYWIPAIGEMRLADVRDHHVSDVVTAMELINRQVPDDLGLGVPEMLRRMYAARADDERRVLAAGETRHKKSVKPLSPARIERMFAPFRAAMNAAVKTRKIGFSPCMGVELPRADKVRPLAWTSAREARFRAALAKRTGAAEAAAAAGRRVLTTVERQELWASPDLRPAPAMTWLPVHCGRFLDYLEESGERFAALFILAAFTGLRRDEVLGLTWAEVDLDEGSVYVRETGSGGGPKSEAGVRVVPLAGPVPAALRAWRKVQAADQLAFGPDWPAHDLVFTREDGSAMPGHWTSGRFETLAYRAGLPCVRFHDLRHGAASMLKAAGVDTAVISAILGHARTSFTDAQYALVFPDVAKAAAEAAVALVPRAARP